MKKIVIMVISLVILSVGIYYLNQYWKDKKGEANYFATWKEFIPQSHLFKVLLPSNAPPQYAKDYLPIPNSDKKRRYDMYASEKVDGSLFLISVITYPPEVNLSTSSEILRQHIDEFMQSKGNKELKKIAESLFQDRQTMDFSIDNKEFNIEGKVIQDDHVIYMLTYIAGKQGFDYDEYEHFVNSFQLLNQPVKKR